MGRHSIPPRGDSAESADGEGTPEQSGPTVPGTGGRRRRADGAPRGVSVGVVVAAVVVVALIGGAVLWGFFSDWLSRRSSDAARQCLQGTATVAVVADPTIVASVTELAASYTKQALPIGDKCVQVTVTQADSDAVIGGLSGDWPGALGERPALWVPASSIPAARLQVAVGPQIVTDARSLVTTPVVLAVRPELRDALSDRGWAVLPALQAEPAGLDATGLTGWGGLRLALPTMGAADAGYLAAEAVAVTSAPPDAPATAGLGALGAMLAGAPRLPDAAATTAWDALMSPGDPAAAAVHAVATTEQQLLQRTTALSDAKNAVAAWYPAGASASADYPTVLLAGPWLADEQLSGASEFARFMREPDQLKLLAKAGFRAEGTPSRGDAVVTFPALAAPLPVGDDATRVAVAGALSPAAPASTTIMLSQTLTGDEGGRPRLANVTAALTNRLRTLPPRAAVGLWTFDGAGSAPVVPPGPLSDRLDALSQTLGGLTPAGGGSVSFTTLRLVYSAAVAGYVAGQPNSVLVITEGPHTDLTLDGPGLQDFIRSALDPARPVAVNVIDFGADPDRPTWEAVAQLTGGTYTSVAGSDSPDLAAALSRTLS
ncbi:MAG: hypothetical protein ACKOB8_12095 [Mycobacterium sp.]